MMKNFKYLLMNIILCSVISCKADAKELIITLPVNKIEQPVPDVNVIQVALLLDTSNSMDGLIDQAKAQLWEIVNELSYASCEHVKPQLQIAIYQYGNDGLSSIDGYVQQVIGFTNDLDDVSEKLFSLTTNGGEEYCGTVIQKSIANLDWGKQKNDLKLIFIAGNESFTQGKVNYIDAVVNAKEKGVSLNTIFCGSYENGISGMWQDGALRSNGEYIAINHNHKTIHVPTPYDEVILQLNIKVNATYVPYGAIGKNKIVKQQMQDDNAAGYGVANEVSRAVSKSSSFYKNSTWDLVDAEISEKEYAKIDKKNLPKELQKKSTPELMKHINKKRLERASLKEQINNLNIKRKTFISKQKNKTKNGLENAMIEAIKKQAIQKNYSWSN